MDDTPLSALVDEALAALDTHIAPLQQARDALTAAADALTRSDAEVARLRLVNAALTAAHPNPLPTTLAAVPRPRRRRSRAPIVDARDLLTGPAIPAPRTPEDDRATRRPTDLPPARR